MKKLIFITKYHSIFLGVILIIIATTSKSTAIVTDTPDINARAFILIDYHSNKVLAEGNADKRLDPASLTKIMFSYIIGQAIKDGKIHPEDKVTVGNDAWAVSNPILRSSSLMFLKPKEQVSVIDLNKGIVIQSGNDASIALANYIAGNQNTFVNLMNQHATSLGLKNTRFLTVHGLDKKGQYSTARDMAILSKALIRYAPDEYALHKEKEFTYNKIKQFNRNRLLWNTNLNIDGVKTGYTSSAGHNLVASATSNNMRLIAVVLGAPTDNIRFSESEKLLTWGFQSYKTITPLSKKSPFIQQRVWYGVHNNVNLGVKQDIAITLLKEQVSNVKTSFTLFSTYLKAPLTKYQVVGTVDFNMNDKVIDQYPLVVLEDIKKGGFFCIIYDWIKLKFMNLNN